MCTGYLPPSIRVFPASSLYHLEHDHVEWCWLALFSTWNSKSVRGSHFVGSRAFQELTKATTLWFFRFLQCNRVWTKMELIFLAFVVYQCFCTAVLKGFLKSSMTYRARKRTCAHCAALDIAVAELRRIMENYSGIKWLDHLFNAANDPPNFFVLNCEEGLQNSVTCSTLSSPHSSKFWDLESSDYASALSLRQNFLVVASGYSLSGYGGGVIVRWWYWWLLRMQTLICPCRI